MASNEWAQGISAFLSTLAGNKQLKQKIQYEAEMNRRAIQADRIKQLREFQYQKDLLAEKDKIEDLNREAEFENQKYLYGIQYGSPEEREQKRKFEMLKEPEALRRGYQTGLLDLPSNVIPEDIMGNRPDMMNFMAQREPELFQKNIPEFLNEQAYTQGRSQLEQLPGIGALGMLPQEQYPRQPQIKQQLEGLGYLKEPDFYDVLSQEQDTGKVSEQDRLWIQNVLNPMIRDEMIIPVEMDNEYFSITGRHLPSNIVEGGVSSTGIGTGKLENPSNFEGPFDIGTGSGKATNQKPRGDIAKRPEVIARGNENKAKITRYDKEIMNIDNKLDRMYKGLDRLVDGPKKDKLLSDIGNLETKKSEWMEKKAAEESNYADFLDGKKEKADIKREKNQKKNIESITAWSGNIFKKVGEIAPSGEKKKEKPKNKSYDLSSWK